MEIVTSCQDCVFQEKDETTGKQTGCKSHDISYWSPELAADGDYFSIPFKICQFKRDCEWKDGLEDGVDPVLKAREEVQIDWVPIVDFKKVDIKATIQKILWQTLPPRKILVRVDQPSVDIANMSTDKTEIVQFRTIDCDLLDWASEFHPAQFHVYVKSWEFPSHFFESLDKQINDGARKFVVLKNRFASLYSGQLRRFGVKSVKTFLENAVRRKVVDKLEV